MCGRCHLQLHLERCIVSISADANTAIESRSLQKSSNKDLSVNALLCVDLHTLPPVKILLGVVRILAPCRFSFDLVFLSILTCGWTLLHYKL